MLSDIILCHLCDVPAPALLLNPGESWNWLSALDAVTPSPSVLWRHSLCLCPRVAGLGESVGGQSARLDGCGGRWGALTLAGLGGGGAFSPEEDGGRGECPFGKCPSDMASQPRDLQ